MVHNVDYSKMWFDIPWNKFERITLQLQRRIYEARMENDLSRVNSLQTTLFNSYSARMLAIRQVTQLNSGKKTAGVDGKSSLTFKERFNLEKELAKDGKRWVHMGLRQIDIPKPDGTKRPLRIPTIRDRAWQCLVKYVLEPAHEAEFHPRSYGFRPGRSTHDAQKIIFSNLNSKSNGFSKRVIELDIEKCFDRINHSTILDKMIAPQFIKRGISSCLKAGTQPNYPDPLAFGFQGKGQGTPQGGVISPLLANIALNGIEAIHPSVRYADDMVIFLKPNEDEHEIISKINDFIKARGMNISKKKTIISKTTDGFNFLGWHFKISSDGKFRSQPSKSNYLEFKKKVKSIVHNPSYGASTKSIKLAPIIRGWRNYHKYCDMERHNLWHLNNSTWKTFMKEPRLTKDKAYKLIKASFPSVSYSVNKFINIKQNKSPFDGDFVYWSKRNSKRYDGLTVMVLKKQSHICKHCGLRFLDGQQVQLHHIDGNHNNWKPKNLMAVHKSCHQIIHHNLAYVKIKEIP
jgi:RNA-directed DNA polymerase